MLVEGYTAATRVGGSQGRGRRRERGFDRLHSRRMKYRAIRDAAG